MTVGQKCYHVGEDSPPVFFSHKKRLNEEGWPSPTKRKMGFLMGVPFPLGIRWLKESGMESTIPWMWGINGVSSVFGSVVAIVIAISLGFTEVLLICAGCYFLIFLVFYKS